MIISRRIVYGGGGTVRTGRNMELSQVPDGPESVADENIYNIQEAFHFYDGNLNRKVKRVKNKFQIKKKI